MEYVIQNDERKIMRDINKILSKDIRKYLAELLTNADDSYSRLEDSNLIDSDKEHPIYIRLKRNKRIITVIDNAEGMNAPDLATKFTKYGADTSGNEKSKRVRGMFGQGATDVLLASALEEKIAKITSIKNDDIVECDFYLDDTQNKARKFRISENELDVNKIRDKYDIPSNGTIVEFGVPSNVSIPRTDNLVSSLSDFYMLRFLNSKSNRKIILIDEDNNNDEKIIKYDYNEYKNNEVLISDSFDISYNQFKIGGTIELRHVPKKSNTDNGILVYDVNEQVYDNQFFERTTYAGMEQIEGRIALSGASEMIIYYLNYDKPEEIVTDSRDGLKKDHDFYKILKNAVDKYLIKACEMVNDLKKSESNSLKKNSQFRDAFNEVNKFFKEELEDVIAVGGNISIKEPPSNGIRFVRDSINITKDKKYSIRLLINTDLVPAGTLISIVNDNEAIEIDQKHLVVEEAEENPTTKAISILGNEITNEKIEICAKTDEYECKLFVSVIDNSIHYPAYGLEFYPNILKKKPLIKSKAHLYIDLNKYPIGTEITFKSHNKLITLGEEKISVSADQLINDEIAKFDLEISGGNDEGKYKVDAIAKGYKTELVVDIRETEEPNENKGGLINDIQPISTVAFCQTFYDEEKAIIYINEDNIINKNMLPNYFDQRSELSKDQKKYVCELAANECAKLMIKKKIDYGKIDPTNFESYSDEVQKTKVKIYEIFFKILG